MAIHNEIDSLVRDSVTEYLAIADYCIMTAKPIGGCYGSPAALLLFTIVDTIGSYHYGDEDYKIKIGDGMKSISQHGSQHYYILNSPYYGQCLTGDEINKLYKHYRCPLSHNAALPRNHSLCIGEHTDPPFSKSSDSQKIDIVNLMSFANLSHSAVNKFLKVSPSLIPNSAQSKIIEKKK